MATIEEDAREFAEAWGLASETRMDLEALLARRAKEAETRLLQFVGSLTLGEHMGDVADDVDAVLKRLGKFTEWDTLDDLGSQLGAAGVTTLYGTSLEDDEDEDEDEDEG